MGNNYARESISFGSNPNLPDTLNGLNNVDDGLMNSVGLYSKHDIEYSKFNKYSRFGRVLNPYGRVNPGREYLFFIKPDLHISIPYGSSSSDFLYRMSGTSFVDDETRNPLAGLTLNPQLFNHPYFKELIRFHPDVVKELQYSAGSKTDPFSKLLSFSVISPLGLGESESETMDTPATLYGTHYDYLLDSESSDENYKFTLEFEDTKDLDTYHFFKAFSEYQIARKSGLVTPPSLKYYQYKMLHNTMGIYKFIVAEDMETILYWAYLWGVYPTSCPRESFEDPAFTNGLTFSVNFNAAFIEDMNPLILYQFNKLMSMNPAARNIDNYVPITKDNSFGDGHYGKSIDGSLLSAALVDGRRINREDHKYRLRWYK